MVASAAHLNSAPKPIRAGAGEGVRRESGRAGERGCGVAARGARVGAPGFVASNRIVYNTEALCWHLSIGVHLLASRFSGSAYSLISELRGSASSNRTCASHPWSESSLVALRTLFQSRLMRLGPSSPGIPPALSRFLAFRPTTGFRKGVLALLVQPAPHLCSCRWDCGARNHAA